MKYKKEKSGKSGMDSSENSLKTKGAYSKKVLKVLNRTGINNVVKDELQKTLEKQLETGVLNLRKLKQIIHSTRTIEKIVNGLNAEGVTFKVEQGTEFVEHPADCTICEHMGRHPIPGSGGNRTTGFGSGLIFEGRS